MTTLAPALEPRCTRCNRRHAPDLPCWTGKYRDRITRRVFAEQGRVCWVGGEYADAVDHVTPRSEGGRDDDDNLRPICAGCNGRRSHQSNPFPEDPPHQAAGVGLSTRWRGA
jgi:5-methylcytosine-specific restriction endonuclease McrA